GGPVTAGFWNSHVHFTGAAFHGAETAPAAPLGDAMRAMLTSYGVVHAIDTGSALANTLALRRRVESGEVPGPAILPAGSGVGPPGGGIRVRTRGRQPLLHSARASARATGRRRGPAPCERAARSRRRSRQALYRLVGAARCDRRDAGGDRPRRGGRGASPG